ncbi:hypothetical protein DVA86_34720 [Streptomyces armeniacus]|uniref:Uncharacterized protein n=1 Tax=Streptomyces armeniacus TaxID=83291 RepID=A0A345XZ49_9ACTN|nr:hypothetical protein DVA86_34720 [Streptomyces armeniacus]
MSQQVPRLDSPNDPSPGVLPTPQAPPTPQAQPTPPTPQASPCPSYTSDAHLTDTPRARTRTSHFTALRPAELTLGGAK